MTQAGRPRPIAALAAALAVLAGALALANVANAQGGARASIIGGTPASTEQWPSTAFVLALNRRDEGFVCTGTVVAPTLVLTAGHCVEDIVTARRTPVRNYAIVTGSADIRDKALRQVSKVRRALVFPGFNRFKLHGDAGLLILKTPTTAAPLAIAGPEDIGLLGPRQAAQIAGWGQRGANLLAKQTLVLRQAETFVQRRLFCRNHARVYYPFYNSSSQLCTITPSRPRTGTCHGDSGGPALAFREDGTPVQIGITSLGPPNCDSRLPDVFTRVDRVAWWVNNWIAATTPAEPVPPSDG